MLHDIKATEKSIAAGGRDSIKDEETGVSNPYDIKKTISPQELKAKLTKLQELVLKTNLPGKPVSVSSWPCRKHVSILWRCARCVALRPRRAKKVS